MLIDSPLTLAVYALSAKTLGDDNVCVGDRLKSAKLVFLVHYPLFEKAIKSFSFSFQIDRRGPFTEELWDTWDSLESGGYLDVPPSEQHLPPGERRYDPLKVTDAGFKRAYSFIQHLKSYPENDPILEQIRNTALHHGRKQTQEIADYCYELEVTPCGATKSARISDIDEGTFLTMNSSPSVTMGSIKVDEDWLTEFDIEQKRHASIGTPAEELARLHTLELVAEVAAGFSEIECGEYFILTRDDFHGKTVVFD